MKRAHYSSADLTAALRRCGVASGDILFSHLSVGMLGYPDSGSTEEAMFDAVLQGVLAAIGPAGTWLVPTYTYSFCRNQPYDPSATPSTVGPFTERFRRLPGAARSLDPIFPVSGIGPGAQSLLAGLPRECFGPGCLYDRLVSAGAKMCNIGVGFRTVTFIHYTEQRLGAPYRFLKPFWGEVLVGGKAERQRWLYNVQVQQENALPDLHALEREAAARGSFRSAPVGRGSVTVFACAELDRLSAEAMTRDAWALARGPRIDLLEAERRRLGEPEATVEPPASPAPADRVKALCRLPAHPLSRAYDAGLAELLRGTPASIAAYRTGSRAGDGVVPEAWHCREARVETLSGARLLSSSDSPLHAPYFSAPFTGEVSREDLRKRLRVHREKEAVPLASLFGSQDWGLACSRAFKDGLSEERYRVSVDSARGLGEMRVGHWLLRGETGRTIALVAHPDHGGLANDGLSGAVAGIELMKELAARARRRYAYLLVLAPKGFGPAAFFQGRPDLAASLEGMIVLESLGIAQPLALQWPRREPGAFERRCRDAAGRCGEPVRVAVGDGPWLSADETPALPADCGRVCLARAERPLDREAPYAGFRSSLETADLVSRETLERSLRAAIGLLGALES